VRARLAEWYADADYAGAHGASGWGSDQQILYRTLLEHGRRTRTVWILNDHFTRFRRLEGVLLQKRPLTPSERRLIARGAYSDFHATKPYDVHAETNDGVVELAVQARLGSTARRRRAG
jgi:hypothetical protein